MSTTVSLNRGQYSGQIVDIRFLQGFTVGCTRYTKESFANPMHYHENPHISFFLTGGHVEKREHTSLERLPGDIMFCNGGEPHQFITKIFPSKNINLELDNDFLREYSISEGQIQDEVSKNLDAKFLMLKIYKELLINDKFSETSIQMLLLSLIGNSIKQTQENKPKWVLTVSRILNDKWNEPITLEDLSNITQIHRVTISKYFTKYFACTLGEYMRKLRINKSIELIRRHSISLTEIAFECGFADQSHFIRSFKEMTGWLPKKFQQL
jgi:AraC family transcriptional regulator